MGELRCNFKSSYKPPITLKSNNSCHSFYSDTRNSISFNKNKNLKLFNTTYKVMRDLNNRNLLCKIEADDNIINNNKSRNKFNFEERISRIKTNISNNISNNKCKENNLKKQIFLRKGKTASNDYNNLSVL